MIFSIDDDSGERAEAVNDWFDASQRDRLAEALLDENGLRPTDAALDVLMAVVRAIDQTDERPAPSVPAIRQYAANASAALTRMVTDSLRAARKNA